MTAGEMEGLVLRIIELLAEHGQRPEDYQLYDAVDPDALKKLVASSDNDLAVTFQIEDVQVTVSGTGEVWIRESTRE